MKPYLRNVLGALVCLGSVSFGAQAQTTPPAGRLLASNCFQCHGTNGKGPGFDAIAGKSPSEVFNKLKEFQSGKEGAGIMTRHAMGYTDAQLHDLSAWLSTQR
jgi:sulfide dehydrogenase cytochrome subunit